MDHLHKLTDRLPSGITQNIPGLNQRKGGAQGQGQTQQAAQYPPQEWSQSSTPVATPGTGLGPPPTFPVPSHQYQPTALAYDSPNQNRNGGITEKPVSAAQYQDPYPTPGSAKTGNFLAPAAPVARPNRWVSFWFLFFKADERGNANTF
jgi:hypothetical protein